MEDLFGKEEMDALKETGAKAKGEEVVEEEVVEEETEVGVAMEEEGAGPAGLK